MKTPQVISLNLLKPGKSAVITDIHISSKLAKRLKDLGFLPGTWITCVGESPQGNPRAYLVRGCVMALRREDAGHIFIQEVHTRGNN